MIFFRFIDGPTVAANKTETESLEEKDKDSVKSGITDLTSTLLNMNTTSASEASSAVSVGLETTASESVGNTSHEVQDILSEFNTNAGAPALPPKQNASSTLNRPSR